MPLRERALIKSIRAAAQSDARRNAGRGLILKGIGDDCAVLRIPAGSDTLVTTDFSLEGIHFRRDWHPPESVGHRCLARGLSDIAGMGGEPVALFLSLALPGDLGQAWVDRFLGGLIRLGAEHGVSLAGGDTAASPNGILADIVVVGAAPKGKAVLRTGARPGDAIYVSGTLGGSASAVRELERRRKKKLNPRNYSRHFYPEPRLKVGRILREKGLASAMIDTSDGLSVDLAHICEESGVGAEVESDKLPLATIGKPGRAVDLELALHGGEDYELLFTARPEKKIPTRIAGVPITRIGYIKRTRHIFVANPNGARYELIPRGWEHFGK
jgi:thiamine-monophosphate kinase